MVVVHFLMWAFPLGEAPPSSRGCSISVFSGWVCITPSYPSLCLHECSALFFHSILVSLPTPNLCVCFFHLFIQQVLEGLPGQGEMRSIGPCSTPRHGEADHGRVKLLSWVFDGREWNLARDQDEMGTGSTDYSCCRSNVAWRKQRRCEDKKLR